MRRWLPLSVPAVIFFVLAAVLLFFPGAEVWANSSSFRLIPYIILTIGFILGIFFLQSRISFICILLSVITFYLDNLYFGKQLTGMANTVVFLSSIYVPVLCILFYHLGERGMFTVNGYIRFVIVLSALVVILLIPKITDMSEAVISTNIALFRPVAGWLNIPLIGMLTLAVCGPFFFIRNGFESPCLGPLIMAGIVFIFAGLNFGADIWDVAVRRTVLFSFMSGAAVTFSWAILEISWRNAHIDELTELPGRRSFKNHMERLGAEYSIAMVDIDFFKKVNDKYGHDTGDQVLRYVASFLRKNRGGKAYRYGGEEFAIISENMDYEEFCSIMEELKDAISNRPFVIRSRMRPKEKPENVDDIRSVAKNRRKKYIVVTVSIGVARVGKRYLLPQEVIEGADKALYKAKRDGRNRVVKAR